MDLDIARWLAGIGLPQYTQVLEAQGFDELGLAELTEAELENLGISAMGHRKIILREAARLAGSIATPSQAPAAPAAPAPSPRGRVFLSYGHDPACVEIVERIMGDLHAAEWEPWVDVKRIRFGDDWRREITRGIQDSQHVLAFLSQHSTRKPGVCRQEVAIALGPRKGHVYTVLVEPLERVSPPLIVSHLQWLDMQQWQELKAKDPPAYEALYRKSLQEILRVLERNEPFAGDIELLQRWLDPLDGTADMLAAEEGFTGRHWLLDGLVEQEDDTSTIGEIERWRTSGSDNRVFWLSAGPGWGKSAVAARLAHAARARVMAVHYCRYNKPNTRDARQVVRTLAFQMATQLGDYRELLVRQAKQGAALAELNAMELFDKLLANPLVHELGGDRSARDRHLIVLDALDETLENDRSELLTLVAGEFGKLPPWLGLVVTSRPEAPVMRQLGAFGVQHQKVSDPRNLDDLRTYVKAWLQGVALEPAQREQALGAVVQASEGMFLYVRQLREAVNAGNFPPAQLTDPASLPKGLAALYERWFQARFRSEQGQAAYDQWQRPLLELMLAAREPLPLTLASAVLGWGAYGEANALEPLGTLCTQQGGTVSLFHKSLADWLARREESGRHFHASPMQGHQRLAAELWAAYTKWREAGAQLQGCAGWQDLGEAGEAYALRHLPAHMKAFNLLAEWEQTLTDFRFAMKRCASGAVEALIEDYRDKRLLCNRNDPAGMWARLISRKAHLLRRAHDGWPAQCLLWQAAAEHAENSPITAAAEQFLSETPQPGMLTLLRRTALPCEVAQTDDALQFVIEIGEGFGNVDDATKLVVLNPSRALLLAGRQAFQLDIDSGILNEAALQDIAGALPLSDDCYAAWTHQGLFSFRDPHSGRTIVEYDLNADDLRPRTGSPRHPSRGSGDASEQCGSGWEAGAVDQGSRAPNLVVRIGITHIAVCTSDRLLVLDFQAHSIRTDLRLSHPVDGLASNGAGRVFFWQGLEEDPGLFDIGSDCFSRIVTDFASANLDGAFFANLHTVVFWADGDICIYNLNTRSTKYIEVEFADLEKRRAGTVWLGVRPHPVRAEIVVWSSRRIARYAIDGNLICEVFPPNEFQGFAIREDDSFVAWDAPAAEDFLWSSGPDESPIVGEDVAPQSWKLLAWSPSSNQVLFIDRLGVLKLSTLPIEVDALSGTISQLDGERIIYFDSSEGRLQIFGIEALLRDAGQGASLSTIRNPWVTEQGRVAYLNEEDDLCILFKGKPEVEHVVYGMSLEPDELLVGRDQIAVRCGESTYLYKLSGVLRWRKRIGRSQRLIQAANGRLISWDARRIFIWEDGAEDPLMLRGMKDHLDDDPISGATASPCGQLVAAWNRQGEIHVWDVAAPGSPRIAGIFEKISCTAVSLLGEVVVIVVQSSDGVVKVRDDERLIATKSFQPDSLMRVEIEVGELVVVFRDGARWNPHSGAMAYSTHRYRFEVQERAIRLVDGDCHAEWHSTFDIDWAEPIGDSHVLVASHKHGHMLNLVYAGVDVQHEAAAKRGAQLA